MRDFEGATAGNFPLKNKTKNRPVKVLCNETGRTRHAGNGRRGARKKSGGFPGARSADLASTAPSAGGAAASPGAIAPGRSCRRADAAAWRGARKHARRNRRASAPGRAKPDSVEFEVGKPVDKPGSVVDSHSSRRTVTGTLKQPTRKRREQRHCFPIRPCSGWGLPCRPRYRVRGELLPHRFTLT